MPGLRTAMLLTVALFVSLSPIGSAEEAPQLPIDQTAYRVQVVLTFGRDGTQDLEFRRGTVARLQESINRSIGPAWNCRVSEESSGSPEAIAAVARLSASELLQRFPEQKVDKVYLLAIDGGSAGFRIAGREWDAVTRDVTPPQHSQAVERRDVPPAALGLLHHLFRPLLVLEPTRWGGLSCRAKGGELADPAGDWNPLAAGRLFEPYFRYLTKERTVERVQRVPWTYVMPTDPERSVADCQVITGLRSPLSGRRRRVETVALGIRRHVDQTSLRLLRYPPLSKPLPGVELELVRGEGRASMMFVSDRAGIVRLPGTIEGEAPYFWLNARSGQAWLARVPYIPGLRREETLELPDDSPRLRAEGELALLQAELVDTVARRAVLAATARARSKDKRWKEMDDAIREVRELPRAEKFASELNTIRVRYVREAREAKDRAAEARVVKLCADTGDLIRHYLDDDKLRAVREELDELRRIALEDEAAQKQFEAQEARRKK